VTLPNGWVEATIGDIAETKLGKMLDAAKNKGEPVAYLRNVNVRWGCFDLTDLRDMRVTSDEYRELAVRDGDLFVCEGGEPGRCAVWRGGSRKLVFQKALHRVRGLGGVDIDYLASYLSYAAINQQFDSLLTGMPRDNQDQNPRQSGSESFLRPLMAGGRSPPAISGLRKWRLWCPSVGSCRR